MDKVYKIFKESDDDVLIDYANSIIYTFAEAISYMLWHSELVECCVANDDIMQMVTNELHVDKVEKYLKEIYEDYSTDHDGCIYKTNLIKITNRVATKIIEKIKEKFECDFYIGEITFTEKRRIVGFAKEKADLDSIYAANTGKIKNNSKIIERTDLVIFNKYDD